MGSGFELASLDYSCSTDFRRVCTPSQYGDSIEDTTESSSALGGSLVPGTSPTTASGLLLVVVGFEPASDRLGWPVPYLQSSSAGVDCRRTDHSGAF